MWDLLGPGLEPASPALAGGFLTTVPPGKPHYPVLILYYSDARCYHWGKMGKRYTGSLCSKSYSRIWIYNYLKIKSLNTKKKSTSSETSKCNPSVTGLLTIIVLWVNLCRFACHQRHLKKSELEMFLFPYKKGSHGPEVKYLIQSKKRKALLSN